MFTASFRGKRARRVTSLVAVVGAGTLLLSACASGGKAGSTTAGTDGKTFAYLSATENTTVQDTLKKLSTTACSAQNKALPLAVSTVPQANIDQKLQLLAGQKALPTVFQPSLPSTVHQLLQANQVVDVTKALTKLGVADDITPAALSTMKQIFGPTDVSLPTEFNVEGIWYNKKIFAANNITIPTTWDELVADSAKLNSAGVQPFAADGKDGWPITRLLGNYIFRDIGPDAMKAVEDGKAKLTDAEYVKAASAIASLGKAGYFGKSVGSIDYNTATNEFLTGKTAMFYMGSWILSSYNDPKQNKIGSANIGFMPFPTVAGGKGTIDQIPANVGTPITLASGSYGPKTAAWVKCIAQKLRHHRVEGRRRDQRVQGEHARLGAAGTDDAGPVHDQFDEEHGALVRGADARQAVDRRRDIRGVSGQRQPDAAGVHGRRPGCRPVGPSSDRGGAGARRHHHPLTVSQREESR